MPNRETAIGQKLQACAEAIIRNLQGVDLFVCRRLPTNKKCPPQRSLRLRGELIISTAETLSAQRTSLLPDRETAIGQKLQACAEAIIRNLQGVNLFVCHRLPTNKNCLPLGVLCASAVNE